MKRPRTLSLQFLLPIVSAGHGPLPQVIIAEKRLSVFRSARAQGRETLYWERATFPFNSSSPQRLQVRERRKRRELELRHRKVSRTLMWLRKIFQALFPSTGWGPWCKVRRKVKKILNEIIGSESGKCLYPLPLPPYSKAEKQQNQSPLECPHLCWSTGFRDPSSLTDICALGGMGALEWPLTDQSSGNLGTLCMDSGTPDRNEDASFIGWRMTHSRYPSYPVSGDTVPPQQLTHKEERDPPWLWLFPHNTHWVWLFGDYMKSYILNP